MIISVSIDSIERSMENSSLVLVFFCIHMFADFFFVRKKNSGGTRRRLRLPSPPKISDPPKIFPNELKASLKKWNYWRRTKHQLQYQYFGCRNFRMILAWPLNPPKKKLVPLLKNKENVGVSEAMKLIWIFLKFKKTLEFLSYLRLRHFWFRVNVYEVALPRRL